MEVVTGNPEAMRFTINPNRVRVAPSGHPQVISKEVEGVPLCHVEPVDCFRNGRLCSVLAAGCADPIRIVMRFGQRLDAQAASVGFRAAILKGREATRLIHQPTTRVPLPRRLPSR